jgi:hypothetical protein
MSSRQVTPFQLIKVRIRFSLSTTNKIHPKFSRRGVLAGREGQPLFYSNNLLLKRMELSGPRKVIRSNITIHKSCT